MSLHGALSIGRSGLLNSQTAMETVGNNLANLSTPGYRRQSVNLSPAPNQELAQGDFIGRGVQLQSITRHIDEALETRLRGAIADTSGSKVRHQLLQQIETIQNEYGSSHVSGELEAFFDAWSEVANQPEDVSKRTLLVQQAQSLAEHLAMQRKELGSLRGQVNDSIRQSVGQVNDLLAQVEDLNNQIAVTERGAGEGASALRDQRDTVLAELAEHLDISTQEASNGKVDVFLGSTPIVLDGKARPLEMQLKGVEGEAYSEVKISSDGTKLDASSGELGAKIGFVQNDLPGAIETLDGFAHELAWQVNRVHSQGQGLGGVESVTAAARVDDVNAALNSEAAGLAFEPGHGSFQFYVTNTGTGQRSAHTIDVRTDASDPADNTSLTDVMNQIDGIDGVGATITAQNQLAIEAEAGDFELSFGEDTSGALAALGINTFFEGHDARSLKVGDVVAGSPERIAASGNHQPGDNSNAGAIAGLRDASVEGLGGDSLTGHWRRHVEDVAAKASQAGRNLDAAQSVQENLKARQQSISGVNADEEAIDLMRFQRSYQANARFLTTVDEMMQTLLAMV